MKIYRWVFKLKPVMGRPRKEIAAKVPKARRPWSRLADLDARETRLSSSGFMLGD